MYEDRLWNKLGEDLNFNTSSIDRRSRPDYKNVNVKIVEYFFDYFIDINNPDTLGIPSSEDTNSFKEKYEKKYHCKFDVNEYIHVLKSPELTPYLYKYIYNNLDKIWSTEYGLTKVYSPLEYLDEKSPKLAQKIDTICSVCACIRKLSKLENNSIDELKRDCSELNNKITNKENNITNKISSELKNSIYPEIITILGIFTAITFAIFGGMNLLSSLFKNIDSTKASLGQTLILAAIFGLVMYGIIELLFYWVSKIKIPDDNHPQKTNWHRIFLIGLFVGVLASILGIGIWLFLSGISRGN